MSWAPSWTEKFQISVLVSVRLVPAGKSGDLFSLMEKKQNACGLLYNQRGPHKTTRLW